MWREEGARSDGNKREGSREESDVCPVVWGMREGVEVGGGE